MKGLPMSEGIEAHGEIANIEEGKRLVFGWS